MTINRKNYRKSLNSKGLIFLAGEEIEITVTNISITGMSAEFPVNNKLTDINAFFKAISSSATIDIFIPEFKMVGESEITRVELENGLFTIGVEFINISYNTESILYKRKSYRKLLAELGAIIIDKKSYHFSTKNISVEGLMIRIPGEISVNLGVVVKFNFHELDISGDMEIIWCEYDSSGGTLMGLKYTHLKKSIEGIPRFEQ